jgi:caffeoyl-CoA O-methyltransferase
LFARDCVIYGLALLDSRCSLFAMNKSFGNDDAALERYVQATYAPEDDVLREIRERSRRAGLPDIQIAPLDGRHLEVLARASGARRAVEVGTLGGYSGVCLMRGLGPDGELDTFEREPVHARVAEESFKRAGFASRVRVHLGPAAENLAKLDGRGPFDLCFIDADKESYPVYLAWAARNLRSGGLILADNAFLFGALGDEDGTPSPGLVAMREFHDRLARSGEFRATVLPTGEGLAVAVRA